MSTIPTFTVRFEGPTATASITWEQVRAYITSHGWAQRGTQDDLELWQRDDGHGIWQTVWIGRFPDQEERATVERAIRAIAFAMGRREHQVLREIADLPDDAAVLAAWRRWCAAKSRWSNGPVQDSVALLHAEREAWTALCKLDPEAERAGRGEAS